MKSFTSDFCTHFSLVFHNFNSSTLKMKLLTVLSTWISLYFNTQHETSCSSLLLVWIRMLINEKENYCGFVSYLNIFFHLNSSCFFCFVKNCKDSTQLVRASLLNSWISNFAKECCCFSFQCGKENTRKKENLRFLRVLWKQAGGKHTRKVKTRKKNSFLNK